MRNKIVYLVMAGTLMLTGCSGASTAGDTESQAETVEASESEAEDVETNAEADAQGADSEQEAAEDGELMPSSFVETVAGKTDFASYDEIISYLKKGQGYAYIKLKGYNGDILAITESVYTENNENHSIDVSLYGEKDGVVKNLGNAFSTEEKYPIAVGGDVVYACYSNNYESLFITPDGDGLMVKDYIYGEDDGSGKLTYSGFLRESNNFDDTADFTGGEKEFNEYWENYKAATPINFTVVE